MHLGESVALGRPVRIVVLCGGAELTVAVWTLGPNWPNNGEIDIMEGVNQVTYNAATLHSYGNRVSQGHRRTH
jgi:hypothetical protein